MASSQQPSSGTTGFLSLPQDLRRHIYKNVLVVQHPLFLFKERESQLEAFAPEKPRKWLALFYTNRQIYSEARAVLYESNRFTFVDTTPHQLSLIQSFIGSIGSINTNHLSHLCINFPVVERMLNTDEVVLREDSQTSLTLLRENCVNLKTLEAQVHGENFDNLIQPKHCDAQLLQKGLRQINTQVRAIRSLEIFIVRIYSGVPSSATIESMQEFGWIVFRGDRDHRG